MKRGYENVQPPYDPSYDQRAKLRPPYGHGVNGMPMCIKALISMKEASSILGPGGSTCREIGQHTGTKLHISGRNEFYPGTSLQELSIRGPCTESVGTSLMQVFGRLAEESGRLCCGDQDVEEGGARVKLLVPISAAKAIIGRGGENIKALRSNTGLYVHIDEVAIGAHDAAEQLVSMQGSLQGVQAAVPNIIEKVSQFMADPGFSTWASSSQAGFGAPVATQVAPGKASGKGKGGYGSGPPRTGTPVGGEGGNWSDGWTRPPEEGAFGALGPDMSQHMVYAQDPSWSHPEESPAAMDMVSHAVQSLPVSCLGTNGKSQRVFFNIPAACVSAIIGKGGSGVKEISAGTQTKIMIREIVDKQNEKQVTLLGDALGVVAAYLHIVGRIAAFEELAAAGGNPEAAFEDAT
mmetsp:Transcript_64987/g.128375  ORF Transcript_64987/g.128375 Transcript_64987/m.128375 type:complete len:407 (-) Transcript_64987:77-1297(-)